MAGSINPDSEIAAAPSESIEVATQGEDDFSDTPWQVGQEWANALTHGFAAIATIVLGVILVSHAADQNDGQGNGGMMIGCAAYTFAVFGTFFCSTLSHLVRPSALLNRLRSWDQAMIYLMISGTYTPIIYQYAGPSVRFWLLSVIWVAAFWGFLAKVAVKHRINSIGTISYLLLGWLPALPLIGKVPGIVVVWMFVGGILYTVGVACLVNDKKVRYMHAVWHLFVMTAAYAHYWTIYHDVVG